MACFKRSFGKANVRASVDGMFAKMPVLVCRLYSFTLANLFKTMLQFLAWRSVPA